MATPWQATLEEITQDPVSGELTQVVTYFTATKKVRDVTHPSGMVDDLAVRRAAIAKAKSLEDNEGALGKVTLGAIDLTPIPPPPPPLPPPPPPDPTPDDLAVTAFSLLVRTWRAKKALVDATVLPADGASAAFDAMNAAYLDAKTAPLIARLEETFLDFSRF